MRGPGDVPLRAETVLAWAALAAVVVGVYVTVVLGGGLLIDETRSPHLGLSVLATLLVAAGFEPVRVRLEGLTGHLLNRGEPPPYEVLARFSQQFASARSPEQVTGEMTRVLAEGTAAQWAQIWLLVQDRLTLVATYPVGVEPDAPAPSLDMAPEPQPGVRSVRVGQAGHVLGLLRIGEQPGRPLTSVGERLFAGLASQAGMVLRSAQLQVELTARLEELSEKERQLRQYRQKLVTSQELERRRLERDLHDGAQQQLVALTINLRLAKTLLRTQRDQALQLLDEQAEAASAAIETLSRLSGGVQPRALSDGGLTEALAAAASVSPVPVEARLSPVGRFDPAVEAAAYFCALEALQNAAKHSGATAVRLELDLAADALVLRISDNGGGVFPEASTGTGLSSMRARAASVGGAVAVLAQPGEGTTVEATIPAARPRADRGPD
jgi:signal transduction histidine kinase